MKPVLADTFYWIALLNTDDAAHERVVVFDGANDRPPLLTTDEILIEFLTFFSGKGTLFRVKAVAIARSLQHNRGVLVLPQTHESYLTGLDFYAKRSDKGSGCSPLNDAVGVLLPEWFAAQHARFSGRRLKERLIWIASEARGGDVGVEQVFQFVVARHFMLFPAFFM